VVCCLHCMFEDTNRQEHHFQLNFSAYCTGCLGLYTEERRTQSTPERQLMNYLHEINADDFNLAENSMAKLCKSQNFVLLRPLFARLFCNPATSAPVERVFSQSGLIVRPHRARMTDSMLQTLVFIKCNCRL